MKILSTIWGFIKNFGLKNKVIIAAVLAIISLFFLNRYNYHRYQVQKAETERVTANLSAAQDTIHVTKNKAGKLEYDKLVYLGTVKQLTKEKNDLVAEIKNVKGDVKFITKTTNQIVHDTVTLKVDTSTTNGVFVMTSSYDTTYSKGNFRSLQLKHYLDLSNFTVTGKITRDNISFTALTGLKKTERGYEVFVTPNYPGMRITELEGAVLDPALFAPKVIKKRQSIVSAGIFLGYSPANYDIFHQKLDFTQRFVIGGGINIDLVPILSITKN